MIAGQHSNTGSDKDLTGPPAQGVVVIGRGDCKNTVTSDREHEVHVVKVQMPKQKHDKTEGRDQCGQIPPRSRIYRVER